MRGGYMSKIAYLLKKQFKKETKDNDYSQAYENLDSPSRDMIKGIFELSDLNARDIMIPRVDIITVDSTTDLKSLVPIVNNAGHSRLPVYEETIDNIIGILYAKDLIKLIVDKKKKFQLKKILHEPFFVPETMPLKELLYEFKKRKLHLAVVVDEYGGISGIVTLEDILEEIVGEIRDEYDSDVLPELKKIGENRYELDSRMTISDFNRQLGMDIPTEEFDTIGGFVFDLFGKVPAKDESIDYRETRFKIKKIKGTVISRLEVKLPS
jgi:CBS domain containing-hemolysin-like protein